MAQYYVTALGRGKTIGKKTGTRSTGLQVHARGWDVGARVTLTHIDGKDVVRVYATKGSNDDGGNNDALIATIVQGERPVLRVGD